MGMEEVYILEWRYGPTILFWLIYLRFVGDKPVYQCYLGRGLDSSSLVVRSISIKANRPAWVNLPLPSR